MMLEGLFGLAMLAAAARKPRARRPVNEDEVEELKLYIENESSLYPQVRSIQENLKRKARKGTYDRTKAPKLWAYVVDRGVRQYAKEFATPDYSRQVSRATKDEIARELAEEWEAEMRVQGFRW